MTRQTKASVCLVISLGVLGSIASVARISLIKYLAPVVSNLYFHDLVSIITLSIGKLAVGLICLSLAPLKPLLTLALEKSRSARGSAVQGIGETVEAARLEWAQPRGFRG